MEPRRCWQRQEDMLRRRGLSWRVAPWTPIAGVGAERSRPAGCWSWEAGFMPPAGGQWVSSGAAAHHFQVCVSSLLRIILGAQEKEKNRLQGHA